MPLFLDIQSEPEVSRIDLRRRAYYEYLKLISDELPAPTREFLLSDWYYSDSDRNPHDAWVEAIEIRENASGERSEVRTTQVKIELLSATHRGRITFLYDNVVSYDVASCCTELGKHGDWMSDEVTLAAGGNVLHDITFSSGVTWSIRCRFISYKYAPV